MEVVFLAVLVLLMVGALTSGFPVAFALPGSAILSILLASICGYLATGDVGAYFVQDGPVEWLSAGVTNFRSLYWDVERDTLIAIPLFVFMGIMLQRSKIAEDLLVAMAQLFGPVPGGLGISVVFVGALLAATTGIVGATVIAMGLISLPAMLRNNYSKSLATGTICASGTLGQIIPPSIVLIILADQLASAADQASTARKAEYKQATGEFSMPSEFDVTSASAGDMFMGALIPGVILVAVYMGYILISALLRPDTAPPVPYSGRYDRRFLLRVVVALVPPLSLIFAVLGSIILGVATVNQAGAIGAVGAMIMGGYQLKRGQRGAYRPAVLALLSVLAILVLINLFDLNIKNIHSTRDLVGIVLAGIASLVLLYAVISSAWRAYTTERILHEVMVETAKTTSMVFIILIGAAMLTSAFRGFGGEELVKGFLGNLPGGFWVQFVVVMAVIFLLGFFLDFIEIAVVVVPIVAPILLADPAANITAVWLGVMVGLNIQTSFLTPPFGFALFYLRGVAPPSVKTTQIYKGAFAFILLQLVGLAVAGYFPALVNYMPNRTYLTSDTAPPPANPRLQLCLERQVFPVYDVQADNIRAGIERLRQSDFSVLPAAHQSTLSGSLDNAEQVFALVEEVRAAEAALNDYAVDYYPLHQQARQIQSRTRTLERQLAAVEARHDRLVRNAEVEQQQLDPLEREIAQLMAEKQALTDTIPSQYEESRAAFRRLAEADKKARSRYRRNVDDGYAALVGIRLLLTQADALAVLQGKLSALDDAIVAGPTGEATLKRIEGEFGGIDGVGPIRSMLSKARRALKGNTPDVDKSNRLREQVVAQLGVEIEWRRGAVALLPALDRYNEAIKDTIGVRSQARLTKVQAKHIAACLSVHRDISLNF